jgi:hypothetical protein
MMTITVTAAILGLSLALLILYLLRRDHLYLGDALFWLITAGLSVAFALLPSLVDVVGVAAGVAYPPALILAVVCVALTIKALLSDLALTELRRDVRRLNQRIALLDQPHE